MNREETIRGKLTNVLAKLKNVQPETLNFRDEDNFLIILNMGSFDAVEFTLRLNTEFGIIFGDDSNDIDSLNSFGNLVQMVLTRSPKYQL